MKHHFQDIVATVTTEGIIQTQLPSFDALQRFIRDNYITMDAAASHINMRVPAHSSGGELTYVSRRIPGTVRQETTDKCEALYYYFCSRFKQAYGIDIFLLYQHGKHMWALPIHHIFSALPEARKLMQDISFFYDLNETEEFPFAVMTPEEEIKTLQWESFRDWQMYMEKEHIPVEMLMQLSRANTMDTSKRLLKAMDLYNRFCLEFKEVYGIRIHLHSFDAKETIWMLHFHDMYEMKPQAKKIVNDIPVSIEWLIEETIER